MVSARVFLSTAICYLVVRLMRKEPEQLHEAYCVMGHDSLSRSSLIKARSASLHVDAKATIGSCVRRMPAADRVLEESFFYEEAAHNCLSGFEGLIVAAIPAFNEEATIARVVIGAGRHVDKVLVCDDGSSDMTGEIAERLGAEVVRHERNLGKGAAIRSLFDFAKRLGADVVVTIDADGQHDPDEIPKLVEPILSGKADIVIGSRSLAETEMPRYRRIGRAALDRATVAAGPVKVADTQSGFRAYSKDAFQSLEVTEFGIGIDSEILMKAEGLRLAEVPVGCKYKGVKGSTYNPVTHALSVLGTIVTLVGERHPMTFLGLPGLVLLCVGLYGWIWVINRYAEVQTLPTGTALVSTILLLIGIFAVFSGLILFTISGLVKRYR